MQRLIRWLPFALVLVLLVLVFSLYTRPDFLVQLANQIWTCF